MVGVKERAPKRRNLTDNHARSKYHARACGGGVRVATAVAELHSTIRTGLSGKRERGVSSRSQPLGRSYRADSWPSRRLP